MATFASQADLKAKKISFRKLSENCYAFTAEGDPNTGVIVGDDGVMVIDAQATPMMAREVIRRIRRVTSKPIKYVVLSHYHAVRVLGASAYRAREIIASQATLGLIRERGRQDMASEIGRFPRLFRGKESIPGLTWPAKRLMISPLTRPGVCVHGTLAAPRRVMAWSGGTRSRPQSATKPASLPLAVLAAASASQVKFICLR